MAVAQAERHAVEAGGRIRRAMRRAYSGSSPTTHRPKASWKTWALAGAWCFSMRFVHGRVGSSRSRVEGLYTVHRGTRRDRRSRASSKIPVACSSRSARQSVITTSAKNACVVRAPTSAEKLPSVGAALKRMTISCASISRPSPRPSRRPDDPTIAHDEKLRRGSSGSSHAMRALSRRAVSERRARPPFDPQFRAVPVNVGARAREGYTDMDGRERGCVDAYVGAWRAPGLRCAGGLMAIAQRCRRVMRTRGGRPGAACSCLAPASGPRAPPACGGCSPPSEWSRGTRATAPVAIGNNTTLRPNAFRGPIIGAWAQADCHARLNALNYTIPAPAGALVDVPSAEAFLDFWWRTATLRSCHAPARRRRGCRARAEAFLRSSPFNSASR